MAWHSYAVRLLKSMDRFWCSQVRLPSSSSTPRLQSFERRGSLQGLLLARVHQSRGRCSRFFFFPSIFLYTARVDRKSAGPTAQIAICIALPHIFSTLPLSTLPWRCPPQKTTPSSSYPCRRVKRKAPGNFLAGVVYGEGSTEAFPPCFFSG